MEKETVCNLLLDVERKKRNSYSQQVNCTALSAKVTDRFVASFIVDRMKASAVSYHIIKLGGREV
jgi:predicted phage tail protein